MNSMNNTSLNTGLLFMTIWFSALCMSCVSTQKFQDLQAQKLFLEEENLNLKTAKKEGNRLRVEKEELTNELQSTKDLLKATSANYVGIQTSYEELQGQYDLLSDQNKKLLKATAGEKSQLELKIAEKQNQLDVKLRELQQQEDYLNVQKQEFETLTSKISDREAQILELNQELNAQKEILNNLKGNIAAALSSFNADELQIVQKEDGKVYVSLSQNLLFQKGSNKIDEKGKSALVKLAQVLAQNPDIDILVEGHTDSDGSSARNWDLSVTRATEVVKILQTAGVKPQNLVASGKALYAPVLENDTEENKAKNRRTEIIISPDLNKLFKLINDQE